MAWWTTRFVFRGDALISEGLDPIGLDDFELVTIEPEEAPTANGTESYTRVIVSAYALYGRLRGYYALGVSHWRLDRARGRVYMSKASRHDTEAVSTLSATQRATLRECLVRLSPEAWETSNASFRRQLE